VLDALKMILVDRDLDADLLLSYEVTVIPECYLCSIFLLVRTVCNCDHAAARKLTAIE